MPANPSQALSDEVATEEVQTSPESLVGEVGTDCLGHLGPYSKFGLNGVV